MTELGHDMPSNSSESSNARADALLSDLRRHRQKLQLQNEELRRSQLELAKSRRQYIDLFEQAPNIYLTLDKTGYITNSNIEAKTAFRGTDLRGKATTSLIADEDRQKFVRSFNKTLRQKTRETVDVRIPGKHNNIRFFRITTTTNNHPSSLGDVVLLSAADFTERFVAASRVRSIIDCSPDAIITFNLSGEIVDANFQAEQLMLSSKDNIKSQSIADFMTAKFRKKFGPSLKDKLRRDTLEGVISTYKLKMKDAEGRCFSAIAKVSFIDSPVEKLYVASIRDVTKERSAIKNAIRTRTAALNASRTKSKFLANMSHELRTPITSIMGFAELLADEVESDDSIQFLNSIRKNSHHLKQVINDILDISSIESGNLKIKKKLCNIRNLVAEVFESLKVNVDDKKLDYRLTIADSLPTNLIVDPMRIKQILLNLIGNSIKFTDSGFILVDIRTEFQKSGQAVLAMSVKDSGCGISEEGTENLFNMFYQANSETNRRYGGTGLGLAVSKNLAALMGGDVRLESSTVNEGSEFVFTLKIPDSATKHSAKKKDRSVPSPHRMSATPLKGLRILVVEDGEDIQLLLKSYLRKAGATVVQAINGLEGYEKALADQYDVVLMDIQMPIVDGLEATNMLRTKKYERPIIAVSANAFPIDISRSLKAGCNDHLSKPIQYETLVSKIRHWPQEYPNNFS